MRLGEEEPEDVVLAVELDDVPRELVRGVDLRRPRRDPLPGERADEVAELALLVRQLVPGHQWKGSYATRPAAISRFSSRRRRFESAGSWAAEAGQP